MEKISVAIYKYRPILWIVPVGFIKGGKVYPIFHEEYWTYN